MLRQIQQISEENPKPQLPMLRYKPDSLVLLNIGVLLVDITDSHCCL